MKKIIKSIVIVAIFLLGLFLIDKVFFVDPQVYSVVYTLFNPLIKFIFYIILGVAISANTVKIKKWNNTNIKNIIFIIILFLFAMMFVLESFMIAAFGVRLMHFLALYSSNFAQMFIGIIIGNQIATIMFED